MKKAIIIGIIVMIGISLSRKVSAQTDEVQQLLLNVEKLIQFKRILSDMKKGYRILHVGYNTIKNLSEGNFNLHKTFLDGLMQISPAVKKYRRIADITDYQILLMKEYKNAFNRFKQNDIFNEDELIYMGRVYSNLFNQSLRNLNELSIIITADKLRMSDDERLSAIDRIYEDMEDKLAFLREFNQSTAILGGQRMKEKGDTRVVKRIYGVIE